MGVIDIITDGKVATLVLVGSLAGVYYSYDATIPNEIKYPTEIAVSKYSAMAKEVKNIDNQLEYLMSDAGMKNHFSDVSKYNKKVDSLSNRKLTIISSDDYVKGNEFSDKFRKDNHISENTTLGYSLLTSASAVASLFCGLVVYYKIKRSIRIWRRNRWAMIGFLVGKQEFTPC